MAFFLNIAIRGCLSFSRCKSYLQNNADIRGLLTVDMQSFSVETLYPPYKFSYTGTSSPDSDSLIGTHFHDLITAGTQ